MNSRAYLVDFILKDFLFITNCARSNYKMKNNNKLEKEEEEEAKEEIRHILIFSVY